jgi:hypothetical protein
MKTIIIISIITELLLLTFVAAGRQVHETYVTVPKPKEDVPSPPFPIPLIDPPPSYPPKKHKFKKKVLLISLCVAMLVIIICVIIILTKQCFC